MRYVSSRSWIILAMLIAELGAGASTSHAGPLLDWLFGRRRKPAPTPVAAPTTSFCYPTDINLGGCNTCQSRTVVNYAPQTYYHTTWVRVPVTQYRPISGQDPVTCCKVTYMQPCTTYKWQARRVPQTVYRPFLSRVTYANPCCNAGACNTGAAYAGQPAMLPAQPAAPNGYAMPAAANGLPAAQYGGGYFESPAVGSSVAPSWPPASNGVYPPAPGGVYPPASGGVYPPSAAPAGDATTAPAPGSVEPADTRPSLDPQAGGQNPSPTPAPPGYAGSPGDWASGYRSRESGNSGFVPTPVNPSPVSPPSPSSLARPTLAPPPAEKPADASANQGGTLNPIPDPDANRAAPMDSWPEAPALFDPQDRSARHSPTVKGSWGAVPAVWPEQRNPALAATSPRPTRRSQTALTAATVQPPRLVQPDENAVAQPTGVVLQPRADAQPRRTHSEPAQTRPNDEGWRRSDAR